MTADFQTTMLAIDDACNEERWEAALEQSRALSASLIQQPPVDPASLGWTFYYNFKALFQLGRYQEALALLDTPAEVIWTVPTVNAGWMHSVAAECAAHLDRPEDLVRHGAIAFELRQSGDDPVAAVLCAQTVCTLLDQVDRPDLNTPFAMHLVEAGATHGAARPVQIGLEALANQLDQRPDPELVDLLVTRLPMLAEIDTAGTDADIGLPAIIGRIQAASWYRAALPESQRAALERDDALYAAAAGGDLQSVDRLLDEGANPDATHLPAPGLLTPLQVASFGGHIGVVQRLLKAGAQLELPNVQGRTPLMMAADQNHSEVVGALIDAGANLDQAGIHDQSAVHLAAWQGYLGCLTRLIEAGANIEAPDVNGDTPLAEAVTEPVPDVVRALIEAGANIEALNLYGQTPLMRAAMEDQADNVALLLDKGANAEARDRNGLSALDWARKEGHDTIVALLQERG